MQSTVHLDGVPDRLVVTNIQGASYAFRDRTLINPCSANNASQFGNMLVLSAAWRTLYWRCHMRSTNLRHIIEPPSDVGDS